MTVIAECETCGHKFELELKPTEVILNDECVHCNDKECHDGEHFCRQAMKDNSFYKNARLYKGLEVIQPPTYEELEKENAELKEKLRLSDLEKHYCLPWCSKLTKAKEIIEGLMRFCRCFAQHHTDDIRYKEAEQFLKE